MPTMRRSSQPDHHYRKERSRVSCSVPFLLFLLLLKHRYKAAYLSMWSLAGTHGRNIHLCKHDELVNGEGLCSRTYPSYCKKEKETRIAGQ